MTCAVTATAATDESVTTSGAVLQTRQTVQVRGVVTDSNGMPVIGATVMEEGTSNNGTLTRSDGSFDLTVSRGASLKISYIGYTSVTVKAEAGKNIQVVLNEDSEVLNDVVVVAGVSGPLALQPLFRLRAGSAAAVTGAAAVPTLGEWALMLLAALMAGFAFQNRRRWER